MPFQYQRLQIPEVVCIETQKFEDDRGFFMETYRMSEFAANGIPPVLHQDNCSYSIRGTLRGIHYQKHPKAQGKLIMVLRGEVFDVAVDIRRGSPTCGQWVSAILSDDNLRMLYVPPGFAHGFYVLSEDALVVYKVTEEFTPELDRGISWNDPEIGIIWPDGRPILSPKDTRLPPLKDADNNFVYGV